MHWSMLPASVAVHAAALILFLIIPIAADVELPTPWPAGRQSYIAAAAAPPLPVERTRVPTARSTAAPVTAPDRISEPVHSSDAVEADGGVPDVGGISTGVPAGFGREGDALPPPPPPPPVVQQPTLVRPGGQVREPRKIVHVPVGYPEYARQSRVEGMVIIEATIDERGAVTDARVLRSQPLLEAAALTAVKQWRYTPTLLNGVPVRVLLTITINFTLGDRLP